MEIFSQPHWDFVVAIPMRLLFSYPFLAVVFSPTDCSYTTRSLVCRWCTFSRFENLIWSLPVFRWNCVCLNQNAIWWLFSSHSGSLVFFFVVFYFALYAYRCQPCLTSALRMCAHFFSCAFSLSISDKPLSIGHLTLIKWISFGLSSEICMYTRHISTAWTFWAEGVRWCCACVSVVYCTTSFDPCASCECGTL